MTTQRLSEQEKLNEIMQCRFAPLRRWRLFKFRFLNALRVEHYPEYLCGGEDKNDEQYE